LAGARDEDGDAPVSSGHVPPCRLRSSWSQRGAMIPVAIRAHPSPLSRAAGLRCSAFGGSCDSFATRPWVDRKRPPRSGRSRKGPRSACRRGPGARAITALGRGSSLRGLRRQGPITLREVNLNVRHQFLSFRRSLGIKSARQSARGGIAGVTCCSARRRSYRPTLCLILSPKVTTRAATNIWRDKPTRTSPATSSGEGFRNRWSIEEPRGRGEEDRQRAIAGALFQADFGDCFICFPRGAPCKAASVTVGPNVRNGRCAIIEQTLAPRRRADAKEGGLQPQNLSSGATPSIASWWRPMRSSASGSSARRWRLSPAQTSP
jgi:hypothetical protein